MTKSKIFLTGATGFIGAHVLQALLKRGHSVRVSIRAESKASYILENHAEAYKQGRLSYVVISDMYNAESFVSALEDMDAIVHVASPFPQYDGRVKNVEKEIINPAIEMTTAILQAASATLIKRVVVTSSFAAIMKPSGVFCDYTFSEKDWNPIAMEQATQHQALAYQLSKTMSEKRAWQFVSEENPSFDLVTLNPPMVYGPLVHEFSMTCLNTSSQMLWKMVDATKIPETRLPLFADVRDLAIAHALAIEKKEAGGNRFVVATPGTYSFQWMADDLRKAFPEQASRIPVGVPGKPLPEPVAKLDSSKAAKVLGVKYTHWKDTARDAFAQFFATEKGEKLASRSA